MSSKVSMNTNAELSIDDALRAFDEEMIRLNLTPTWSHYAQLVSKQPVPQYKPYLWKAELLEWVVERAGQLVDLERGGERRSFEVVNPELRHIHGTTHTIGAALQLVKPGELATSHRHLASAIRFPVRGKAYTSVNGEKLYMEERDLILTPTWTWHEHGNESDEPVVWIDALDYPFNKLMQVSFFETYPGGMFPARHDPDYTMRWVGLSRPAWATYAEDSPQVTYKWSDTRERLEQWRNHEASPYDGVLLEYVNPFRHGPVLPTLACYAQMLRPGEHTKAHRDTTSSVYYVLEGSGHSVIDGCRFEWSKGDFFMVPPWIWHEHANGEGADAFFFVISDKPIYDSLRLFREEALPSGHQDMTRQFKPLTRSTATV